MGVWKTLISWLVSCDWSKRITPWISSRIFHDSADEGESFHTGMAINPATGLPMVDGIGGVDVAGNPYGVAHIWAWHGSFEDMTSSRNWSSDFGFSSSFGGFGSDW